jgi:hypothetical protein
MGRIMIVLLAAALGLAVPGLAAAGSDADAVLREDDEGVVLATADDDGDDTNTGNTNTGNRDSLDTTADRSGSRDRSRDNTGNSNGRRERSGSRDRSRDNTADHSVGVTTNT